MLERLGNVVYWLSCALAGALLVFCELFGALSVSLDLASRLVAIFGGAIAAVGVWLTGRAARYILSGI